jgi:hypothetical protein
VLVLKKHFSCLLSGILTLSSFSLLADGYGQDGTDAETAYINLSDYSQESVEGPTSPDPFNVSVNFDWVKKTDIRDGYYKGDCVNFAEAIADAGMGIYYCPAYQEGAGVALGYTATLLDWKQNPWYHQNHFHTLTLSLKGFSHRLDRWLWKAQLDTNLDATEWDYKEYLTFDLLLWGRYEYCEHIGVHVGLIAETGMKMDRVYPILGADWQISKRWRLNAIFPVNVSLEYMLNRHWSFALAGRVFNSRHRTKKDEGKLLVRYQNSGAELAVKYENKNMSANVHAGSTLGGLIRIADSNNHHPHHYHLNSSLYAGAEVALSF